MNIDVEESPVHTTWSTAATEAITGYHLTYGSHEQSESRTPSQTTDSGSDSEVLSDLGDLDLYDMSSRLRHSGPHRIERRTTHSRAPVTVDWMSSAFSLPVVIFSDVDQTLAKEARQQLQAPRSDGASSSTNPISIS